MHIIDKKIPKSNTV